jgi:hypothetical protein
MSYEQSRNSERYFLPSAPFGLTADSVVVRGPKGMKGHVRDVLVSLTAAAVGTTSVPEIVVGSAIGLSEYGRFRLGSTAILGYGIGAWRASVVAGDAYGNSLLEDYPGHVKMDTLAIPADTPFVISRVAGVGAPAGTGSAYVTIDWF